MNKKVITALLVAASSSTYGDETYDGYQNFIRQVQLPADGTEGTVRNVPVEATDSDRSPLEINPGGARFELHTVTSDPFIGYLLDSKYVATYVPVAEVQIRTEDNYEKVPRTRADRPFNVEITIDGLRSGVDDPDPSKSVKVLRHIQSYGLAGTRALIDQDQAILAGQGFIESNGKHTLSYLVNSIPGVDRAKVSGEERFSVYSIADYQAPESHLDSLYVQIWPVADGSISGIETGQILKFKAEPITLELNDIYPDSQIYAQVYEGKPNLGTEGTVVPGSAEIIYESVPQKRRFVLENWDKVIDTDGDWTIELLTSTPFGIDRLDYVTFKIDRTLSVNGGLTTIE